ncbi:MAG: hypothetical protein ACSLE1_18665 [Sphingobium sp.]
MIRLMAIPEPFGLHLCGWRRADSYPKVVNNIEAYIELAQLAERALFDAIFIADGNRVAAMDFPALFEHNYPANLVANFEPLTLLSVLSQHTHSIGLVGTASTTFEEPYMHLSSF